MSWLSGIAGRAEALLDKMDQATATSIQSTGLATPSPRRPAAAAAAVPQTSSLTYEPTASVTTDKPPHIITSSTSPQSHKIPYSPVSHPEAPPQTTPTPSSYNAYSKSRAVANDDTIFQFLNTPSKQQQPRRSQTNARRTLSNPPIAQPDKPVVDPNSEVPDGSAVVEEGGGEIEQDAAAAVEREEIEIEVKETEGEEEETGKDEEMRRREDEVDGSHDLEGRGQIEDVSSETPPPVSSGREEDGELGVGVVQNQPTVAKESSDLLEQQMAGLQRKVSDLELENKLLKREVTSLNDELGTVLERVREAEEGVASHRKAAESLREQVSGSERVIRQLRSHDEDMQAALQARDSQIQVLRKELKEVENREGGLKAKLEGEGKEKQRLLHDASRSSEATNHALEVVKSQLQQAQEELDREREAGHRAKREFGECEGSLRSQLQQLSDTVGSQQRQLSLLQNKIGEGQRAVQAANRELAQAKREHEEYKKRAAGILQAKENVISSLQEGGAGASNSAHEASLEQLRLEKEAVRAELEMARLQWEGLRAELQEAEEQHSQETAQLSEQVRELERELMSERTQQRSVGEELQSLGAEFQASREQWERERVLLSALVQEKETELAELKTKVTMTTGHTSQAELESRLHELTESLIQKQTTLETLGSERSSLRLQLERTESQLAAARRAHPPLPHTAVKGLDSENHIHPMTSVLPLAGPTHPDTRLHNVKRAMNSLDSFSVRLAVFLRRYPYARLFLILYMVLLHVWVLLVLLTYTPEAHATADLAPHEP